MKTIKYEDIVSVVSGLCQEANYYLEEDVLRAIQKSREQEDSPLGINILDQLIENAKIAREERLPMCQDTGFAVFFVEVGQDLRLEGGVLEDAINEGVRQGYTEGYLRKSIVGHPLERKNTGDNTPAIIYTNLVAGDKLKITIAPKGGGSENMSGVRMLKPAQGVEGVKSFVIETVDKAGSNPCPPIVVGVGIGGTMEKAALLAKQALLRPLDQRHEDPSIATLEEDLLEEINKLGIGPQGLGGRTTALAVNVEIFPAHIASLPVAVNINCHSARHKTIIL
ncbi:fumarate hydratase [Phosphitispora fastidiosa]|uniref:fumarate hydratase n=1 Tax=Phosphitispora fastidiosa TaxID=2837202 RepID=UPI001E65BC9A|nr:fumarate hydratase [Phosphitispora fastidiosa]MBU7007613.1 fumarate hydratase subunit alpha [Phosphitispora fastidiosa]